jgi:hypothetical protein
VFEEIIHPREEIILPRERESFTPTLFEKSVCGQLLIRSILVLLLSFEVPLEKIRKKVTAKIKIKKSNNKEGTLCVFSFPL